MNAPFTDPRAAIARDARRPQARSFYRHTALVRLTHWVNALAIFVMIGTGLNIFNAHPMLYWGQKGSELDAPFIALTAIDTPHGMRGDTLIGPFHLDTTGFLGLSDVDGQMMMRGWPAWLTLPSATDLADARHWHFFFAWILVVNGLVYLAWSFSIRHIQRDLWPTPADLRAIPRSVLDHLKLKHPTGEAAKRYNVLQRLAYLGLLLLVVGMVLTGCCLSPGLGAFAPWLVQLFGGRQSARTLHFLFAGSIAAFIVVHLVEVVLAGPLNEVRSMITGRYVLPKDHG
jgi:Ni/Fe-hydrogenase b-type cytochrome subunit